MGHIRLDICLLRRLVYRGAIVDDTFLDTGPDLFADPRSVPYIITT